MNSHLTLHRLGQFALLASIGALLFGLGYRQGSQSAPDSVPSEATEPISFRETKKETQPSPQAAELAALPTPSTNDSPLPPEPINWKDRGHESARLNLEDALAQVESLKGREQAAFITGLFTFIAENSTPRDALTIASSLNGSGRQFALKTLVAEWTVDSELDDSQKENRKRRIQSVSEGRFGLEAELAGIIAQTKPDPMVANAWIDAFAHHPGRSEIVARLAPTQADFNPVETLAIAENWTEWEKARFATSLMDSWTRQDPKDAWNWYSGNEESFPTDASGDILNAWARQNANELIQSLDTFPDSANRLKAIEAVSASLAMQGTDKALDWVEGLPPGPERETGFQAVYENTPKGIGALLKMEGGFPKIQEVMPSGALASTDLRAGDLIVESRDAGGEAQNLYGTDLRNVVSTLRGAPGSQVEIRVLREDPSTGELEEHTATVVRDLLILDDSARN